MMSSSITEWHSALVAFCVAQIEKHQKSFDEANAFLSKEVGDEQMCEDMLVSVTTLFEEEKAAESQPWYKKPKWDEVHVPNSCFVALQ